MPQSHYDSAVATAGIIPWWGQSLLQCFLPVTLLQSTVWISKENSFKIIFQIWFRWEHFSLSALGTDTVANFSKQVGWNICDLFLSMENDLCFFFFFVCTSDCFSCATSVSQPFEWHFPTLVGIINQIPVCCIIKATTMALWAWWYWPYFLRHASNVKSPMVLFLLTSLTAKILSCGYQMKRVQPYFFKEQPV